MPFLISFLSLEKKQAEPKWELHIKWGTTLVAQICIYLCNNIVNFLFTYYISDEQKAIKNTENLARHTLSYCYISHAFMPLENCS